MLFLESSEIKKERKKSWSDPALPSECVSPAATGWKSDGRQPSEQVAKGAAVLLAYSGVLWALLNVLLQKSCLSLLAEGS